MLIDVETKFGLNDTRCKKTIRKQMYIRRFVNRVHQCLFSFEMCQPHKFWMGPRFRKKKNKNETITA